MRKLAAFAIAMSLAIPMSGCGVLFSLASLYREPTTEPTTEATTEEITTEAETETTAEPTTEEQTTEDQTVEQSEEITSETNENEVTIKFGELQSLNYSNDNGKKIVVVKAKITPSYSNKSTISQNYFNVEDLIVNQGFDKYDEIQYWAVADMTDGSESKVISFTVDSDLIALFVDKKVPAAYLDEYLDDLWILPSLKT